MHKSENVVPFYTHKMVPHYFSYRKAGQIWFRKKDLCKLMHFFKSLVILIIGNDENRCFPNAVEKKSLRDH